MRIPMLLVLTTAAVSLGACQQKPATPVAEAPRLEKVLPNIPLPPDGQPLVTEASKDAMQMMFASPHPVDTVAAFYRDLLGKPPYRLINEAKTGNVVSFYAEQDGPPLWVAISKNGDTGSVVTIAGADTTGAKPAPAPTAAPKTSGLKPI